MAETMSEGDYYTSNRISSEELLDRVPTAAHLQSYLEKSNAFVQRLGECRDNGSSALEMVCDDLDKLRAYSEYTCRASCSLMVQLGNFCNAGGQIVFVDPPKPHEQTNGIRSE